MLTLNNHGLVEYRKEHKPSNSLADDQVQIIWTALDMMTRTDPDEHRAITITCIDPDASGTSTSFFLSILSFFLLFIRKTSFLYNSSCIVDSNLLLCN